MVRKFWRWSGGSADDQVVLQMVRWIDRCLSDCQMTLWMVRWLERWSSCSVYGSVNFQMVLCMVSWFCGKIRGLLIVRWSGGFADSQMVLQTVRWFCRWSGSFSER